MNLIEGAEAEKHDCRTIGVRPEHIDVAEDGADLMAGVVGWDSGTIERELAHYRARVEAELESQRMPDDRTADAARLGAPDVRFAPQQG